MYAYSRDRLGCLIISHIPEEDLSLRTANASGYGIRWCTIELSVNGRDHQIDLKRKTTLVVIGKDGEVLKHSINVSPHGFDQLRHKLRAQPRGAISAALEFLRNYDLPLQTHPIVGGQE